MGILRGHKKVEGKTDCGNLVCLCNVHSHTFTHLFIYPYLSIYLSISLHLIIQLSLCLPIYLCFFRILIFYPLSISFYCILSAAIKFIEGFGTFSTTDAAFCACSHLQVLPTHAASVPISFGIAMVRNLCGILPSPGRIPPASCSVRAARASKPPVQMRCDTT